MFERVVIVEPADSAWLSSCRIRFVLKGEKGAVDFLIATDWCPPPLRQHGKRSLQKPFGYMVGFHSHTAQYDGQTGSECEHIGGKCYYDGSATLANEWVEDFVAGGTEWLWPRLEKHYYEVFND